jgi:hypothetical protein
MTSNESAAGSSLVLAVVFGARSASNSIALFRFWTRRTASSAQFAHLAQGHRRRLAGTRRDMGFPQKSGLSSRSRAKRGRGDPADEVRRITTSLCSSRCGPGRARPLRELGDPRLEPVKVPFPDCAVGRQAGQTKHNRMAAPQRRQRFGAIPHLLRASATFACDTARSRCQPVLPGSDFASRSAIARSLR